MIKPTTWYYFVATVSGMSVMGIELSASRLLAPYYGTSTYIWTNIIGVMMIALALGYWIGGRVADKTHNPKGLYYSMSVGGLYVFIMPYLLPAVSGGVQEVLSIFSSAIVSIFVGSLITMILIFFVPIFLFAFVSPYIITLISDIKGHAGNISGNVFAFSTLGSIFGTFSPVLLLIPTIGTSKTIALFSVIMIVVGLLGLIDSKYKFLSFVFVLPLFLPINSVKAIDGLVATIETPYQFARVVDQENQRLLLMNEGASIYSMKQLDGVLTGMYFDYYSTLPLFFDKQELKTLILGSATGTISSQLLDIFTDRNIKIDGVEIDKKIIEAGSRYFDMDRENFNVINQDGRIFLQNNKKLYDVIVVDTYSNQLYISHQLTTVEFFKTVAENLTDGGVVAFNVNAISPDSKLLVAMSQTMKKVFPYVNLSKTGNELNYMLIGSNKPLKIQSEAPKGYEMLNAYAQRIETSTSIESDSGAIILTDDWAPIEYLTDYMILEYIYSQGS